MSAGPVLPQTYKFDPISTPSTGDDGSGGDDNMEGGVTLSVVTPLPLENATAAQLLEDITFVGNFSIGSINYDGTSKLQC